MKTLLTTLVVAFAALLPITPAQAAEPAGKKYGDFRPGDKFTMTVATVAEIGKRPSSFPFFKETQKVKFTIGPKGQLTGPKFSIDFDPKGTSKNENYYDNADENTATLVHQAIVSTKGSPAKPYYINLTLRKQEGFSVYQVTYLLEK